MAQDNRAALQQALKIVSDNQEQLAGSFVYGLTKNNALVRSEAGKEAASENISRASEGKLTAKQARLLLDNPTLIYGSKGIYKMPTSRNPKELEVNKKQNTGNNAPPPAAPENGDDEEDQPIIGGGRREVLDVEPLSDLDATEEVQYDRNLPAAEPAVGSVARYNVGKGRTLKTKVQDTYDATAYQEIGSFDFNANSAVFKQIYGTTSFLQNADLTGVKYYYSFGIQSEEASDNMNTYYKWANAAIDNIADKKWVGYANQQIGATPGYEHTTKSYDAIGRITKHALKHALQALINAGWKGESIGTEAGSSKKVISEIKKLVSSQNSPTVKTLGAAFIFPLAKAISHLHNSLKKTIETVLGPNVFNSASIQLSNKGLTKDPRDADSALVPEGGEKRKKEKKVVVYDYNNADLSLVGVVLSVSTINKILGLVGDTDGALKYTLASSYAILHTVKNNMAPLYDSIRIFDERALGFQYSNVYDNMRFGKMSKVKSSAHKKIVGDKLKMSKDNYDLLSTCARHLFIHNGRVYMPSQELKQGMRAVIVYKPKSEGRPRWVVFGKYYKRAIREPFDKVAFCNTAVDSGKLPDPFVPA